MRQDRRARRQAQPRLETFVRAAADGDAHIARSVVRRVWIAGDMQADFPEHQRSLKIRAAGKGFHECPPVTKKLSRYLIDVCVLVSIAVPAPHREQIEVRVEPCLLDTLAEADPPTEDAGGKGDGSYQRIELFPWIASLNLMPSLSQRQLELDGGYLLRRGRYNSTSFRLTISSPPGCKSNFVVPSACRRIFCPSSF